MAEIFERLDGAERERILNLRDERRFFWADVSAGEVTRDQLQEVLGIDDRAVEQLLDFSSPDTSVAEVPR